MFINISHVLGTVPKAFYIYYSFSPHSNSVWRYYNSSFTDEEIAQGHIISGDWNINLLNSKSCVFFCYFTLNYLVNNDTDFKICLKMKIFFRFYKTNTYSLNKCSDHIERCREIISIIFIYSILFRIHLDIKAHKYF